MKNADNAVAKFTEGFNCAQSVFSSFCDILGIEKDTALRIATGFGSGMARKQEVCGAVTGAIMVIGARYGRSNSESAERTGETYEKVRLLMDSFAREYGTWNCRDLLEGCNLNTPEGQREISEKDLSNKVCRRCVKSAAEMVEELLR